MKAAVGNKMGVKAAGGIRDCVQALRMVEAGATRIGTSSGVAIARCCGEIPLKGLLDGISTHESECSNLQ